MAKVARLVLLLPLAIPVYHHVAWHLADRQAPEAGHLIAGHQLHCIGQGSPTVVFENGLGDLLEQWRQVQPKMTTRACSYDRAGYGHSDAGPLPRTAQRIAQELHALLAAAGERPPFVLVASSFGGYPARVYRGLYPTEVSGLVLVDCVQEDQYELLPPSWQAISQAMHERYATQARRAPWEVELGLLRLELWWRGLHVSHLLLQTKYFIARASELENIRVSAEQARAAGSLGNLPLTVLTAGQADDPAFRKIWIDDLQPRLAALSSRGQRIVVENSGHDITGDRPEAVVAAIRRLVD